MVNGSKIYIGPVKEQLQNGESTISKRYHSNTVCGHWVDRISLYSSTMKEEEKLLVEQARDGSEKAFSKLYQKYNKTIWFTIYNIVKNNDVADDLTSVVFTKVYEKLQTYVNHISFEMWLKTIAVNASIDYIRRTKKEQLNNYIDDDEYTGQLDSDTKSPEEQMILSQNVEVIMKCIPLLRKKYRDLIYARLDGKSYHQISEELAIPEATVKTCLNKARAKLRQLFEDYK